MGFDWVLAAARSIQMPTREQVQRRLQFDLATKNALRERGDDETMDHIIEHHFVADDRAALVAVAKIGRMLGYDADIIMEGRHESGDTYWYFDLLSTSPTYLNNLGRESLLMFTLGEAYGADYDGWGTLVVK
jgi:regulator of RNase E activity RraB